MLEATAGRRSVCARSVFPPPRLITVVKHAMRALPLITLGVLVVALMDHSAAGQSTPTNWLTIERNAFSFRVPPDMTNKPLQEAGTSLIEGCVSSNIVLTFAYYPDPHGTAKPRHTQSSSFKQKVTSIDGHATWVGSYHMARPFFLSEGKTNVIRLYAKQGSNALNMVTYCHKEADYATSERIFKSIHFKRD